MCDCKWTFFITFLDFNTLLLSSYRINSIKLPFCTFSLLSEIAFTSSCKFGYRLNLKFRVIMCCAINNSKLLSQIGLKFV